MPPASPLSPADLAALLPELKAKVEAMTPGPWRVHDYTTHVVNSTQEAAWIDILAQVDACTVTITEGSGEADIDVQNFAGIVALRNAAPALLATLEAQATRIAELEAGLRLETAALEEVCTGWPVAPDEARSVAVLLPALREALRAIDGERFDIKVIDRARALLSPAAPKEG